MPDPKVEIKKLASEAPKKVSTEEIKQKWLEEDPNRVPDGFDKLNVSTNPDPNFSAWKSSVEKNISFANSCADDVMLKRVEVRSRDSQSSREIDFQGPGEQLIYNDLVGQFGEDQFDGKKFVSKKAHWLIPSDALREWSVLVEQAKKQVQKNAAQLSVAFGTVVDLVAEEMAKNSPPKDVKAWQGTELYTSIVELRSNLEKWDNFLGSYASLAGDRVKFMTELAGNCAKSFADFANNHAVLYKGFTGADGEPLYLKYQLLATAKAVAEKLASQFAARASTAPSYSAMYELSTSIPVTTSKDAALAVSKGLETVNSLDEAWNESLGKLQRALRSIDKNGPKSVALDNFFSLIEGRKVMDPEYGNMVTIIPLQESLEAWSNYYSSFGTSEFDLAAWQHHTDNISLLLRKCKKTVNETLRESKFSPIREEYQIIFDAFTLNIQRRLLLCLQLVR